MTLLSRKVLVYENNGTNFQCKYEITCNFGARLKDCIFPRCCCGACKQTTFQIKDMVKPDNNDYET